MASQLMRGLCKALYGNQHSMQRLRADMHCSPDELSKCYRDYIESFSKKFGDSETSRAATDVNTDFLPYDEILSFVMKSQNKYSPKDNAKETDKAGQGIAAMSKRINMLYSAYARLMAEKITKAAKNSGKNIYFSIFGSDIEKANAVTAMLNLPQSAGKKFVDNDFTEWDIHFMECCAHVTDSLLRMMSIPTYLADFFLEYRKQWTMIAHTSAGKIKLQGSGKQFSGNPFTLVENTIVNAALTNFLYDFRDLAFAVYVGDDSSHRCAGATLSEEGRSFLAVSQHKLKLTVSSVGEFAGFIMSDNYCANDLFRRAAKFIGGVYKHEGHFIEARASAQASTATYHTEAMLNELSVAAAVHYGTDRIMPADYKQLYHFLKDGTSTMRTQRLQDTVQRVIRV